MKHLRAKSPMSWYKKEGIGETGVEYVSKAESVVLIAGYILTSPGFFFKQSTDVQEWSQNN